MAGYETAPSEEQNVTIDDRGKGKVPMPDADVEEVEEGNGTEEGDADGGEDDDSEKTDMELAWENLETAKLIYNNNLQKLTDEQRLSLAEVHERLADLSMEKEDYETCMTDFKAALAMFVELLPACDRRLASLHFKMALALQFMDEPEVGLTHCQEALKLMESKLDELKNLVPEGNVEEKAADNPAEDIQGVLDDLRDKEVELREVIAQNATTKELIKNAFAQFGGLGGGAATAANVVDLGTIGGSSGKKRVTPAPAAAAIPAAANTTPVEKGEEAPRQEKRKRTLEDLLGGDDGGTTTTGFGGN
uniref:Tetratricopeptide SHNi-TPR domain-containing protein n=1 Tax=Tetraselmis chuii TaxID=63592 RepID=A0A7S1X9V5_9CHLO